MIAENLKQVLSELPGKVRLVAVSKFHPNEAIEERHRMAFHRASANKQNKIYRSLRSADSWHRLLQAVGRSGQAGCQSRKNRQLPATAAHCPGRDQVWIQL